MNRQATDTATEILNLRDRWTRAESTGDVAGLEALLTSDFVGVGPAGFVRTKDQWLERHRSGGLIYQDLTWDDDTSIRRYDDTAIIIGAQHQEATYQGNEIPGQFRCTQIAVRDGGDWVLAGVHLSPILQPPKT